MNIREDETLDDLQLKGLRLIQKKTGFRLCLDAVLLADFARIHPGDCVADLGTGTGVLPLLLWGRGKGKNFWGVEIQEELAEMAERNVKLNCLEEQIRILCCDVAEAKDFIPSRSIDAVVCNPPYPFSKKQGDAEISSSRDISRHQTAEELQVFLAATGGLLKGRGRLFMVYPSSEMLELMISLRQHRLEPKRLRLIHPFSDRPARLVLIEAVNGGRPMLQVLPPLIVYDENRRLTNELKSIYHIQE